MCVHPCNGVETLIVTGPDNGHTMICESYVMNSVWTECVLPDDFFYFNNFIVWKNRLVETTRDILHVYNHNPKEGERHWSKKTGPNLFHGTFFLNSQDHLCLEGYAYNTISNMIWQVWCLKRF